MPIEPIGLHLADATADRRADKGEPPSIDSVPRELREGYTRVLDFMLRNPEVGELAACARVGVDEAAYLRAKGTATVSNHTAFSCSDSSLIRPGDAIVGGPRVLREHRKLGPRHLKTERRCTKCEAMQPLAEFPPWSSGRRSEVCRSCRKRKSRGMREGA